MQLLAVRLERAIHQLQGAPGIQIVADAQPAFEISGDTKRGKGDPVFADHHRNIHVQGADGPLPGFRTHDLFILTHPHRLRRQPLDFDIAARHINSACDLQGLILKRDGEIRRQLQYRIGLYVQRYPAALDGNAPGRGTRPVDMARQQRLTALIAPDKAIDFRRIALQRQIHRNLFHRNRQRWVHHPAIDEG